MSKKEFRQLSWDACIEDDCRHLIRLAIREDLDRGYDWTTVALVPEPAVAAARLVARTHGVAAGLATVPLVLQEMNATVDWFPAIQDGASLEAGSVIGELKGNARDLLTSERTILNLLGRLSGIASWTREHVRQVEGTSARLYDTRKTTPGYRRLEKYAVRCGGGHNHRTGLFDAILIKDNHLAFAASRSEGPVHPREAVELARQFVRQTLPAENIDQIMIEIEVDSLEQLEAVLPAAPDIVLLDNMTPEQLRQAVEMRDALSVASRTELEASGGVRLETLATIARTGVERISVGALTHSAPCLDIGLDWLA